MVSKDAENANTNQESKEISSFEEDSNISNEISLKEKTNAGFMPSTEKLEKTHHDEQYIKEVMFVTDLE